MSKIMLLNLPIQSYIENDIKTAYSYNPSLGIIYMGTWLELNGYEVITVDLCVQRMNIKELLKIIEENEPILIGISTFTENINMALSIAELIKKLFPDMKILFGGAHVTLDLNIAIESKNVDFVISGEGEATIVELVEAVISNQKTIRYKDIPSLVFKENNAVINNKRRGFICDLDLLPIPKRELFGIENYTGSINITSSRGCPGRCIYCAATAISGATYRVRDIDNVFLEIVMLKSLLGEKISKFLIVDDTFTAITSRVKRFINLINEYKIDIKWHCDSRVDVMNKELLEQMSSAGCEIIQYGIESGSQYVLNKIQKGLNLDKAREIIYYSNKNKIIVILSFMLGHYCDTVETMEETVEFAKEMFNKYACEVYVAFNTPFPGTWQYTNRDKIGLRIVKEDYSLFTLSNPVVETDNFTINDQKKVYLKVAPYVGRITLANVKGKLI